MENLIDLKAQLYILLYAVVEGTTVFRTVLCSWRHYCILYCTKLLSYGVYHSILHITALKQIKEKLKVRTNGGQTQGPAKQNSDAPQQAHGELRLQSKKRDGMEF